MGSLEPVHAQGAVGVFFLDGYFERLLPSSLSPFPDHIQGRTLQYRQLSAEYNYQSRESCHRGTADWALMG